jgi:hypothetical protein
MRKYTQCRHHAYRSIARAIDQRRAITPAAEWLVDR